MRQHQPHGEVLHLDDRARQAKPVADVAECCAGTQLLHSLRVQISHGLRPQTWESVDWRRRPPKSMPGASADAAPTDSASADKSLRRPPAAADSAASSLGGAEAAVPGWAGAAAERADGVGAAVLAWAGAAAPALKKAAGSAAGAAACCAAASACSCADT